MINNYNPKLLPGLIFYQMSVKITNIIPIERAVDKSQFFGTMIALTYLQI